MKDPIELERHSWDVLVGSVEGASAFFGEILMDDTVMALPGGLLLAGKDAIMATMGGTPWASYEMTETRVVRLSDDVEAVVYRADAEDSEGQEYVALMTSVYVRHNGAWRLALHQQTPV
jgi:ketosteroid isomerase-like protein